MSIIVTEKVCYICKTKKTILDFYKDRSKKGGYSNRCKSCDSKRSKDWKNSHPERVKEISFRWQTDNREKSRDIKSRWRKSNIEKVKIIEKSYREKNVERERQRKRVWNSKNPDRTHTYNNNRRALETNAGRITRQQWRDLCEYYGNICLCCKRRNINLTLDHIVPLSKGGKNLIENVQPLCKSCNSSKGTKTIDYRPTSFTH